MREREREGMKTKKARITDGGGGCGGCRSRSKSRGGGCCNLLLSSLLSQQRFSKSKSGVGLSTTLTPVHYFSAGSSSNQRDPQ